MHQRPVALTKLLMPTVRTSLKISSLWPFPVVKLRLTGMPSPIQPALLHAYTDMPQSESCWSFCVATVVQGCVSSPMLQSRMRPTKRNMHMHSNSKQKYDQYQYTAPKHTTRWLQKAWRGDPPGKTGAKLFGWRFWNLILHVTDNHSRSCAFSNLWIQMPHHVRYWYYQFITCQWKRGFEYIDHESIFRHLMNDIKSSGSLDESTWSIPLE